MLSLYNLTILLILHPLLAQSPLNNLTNIIKDRPRYDSRIINGVEVKPFFKYPWMAAIRRNGGSFCGGVLLSETYMITAAHCSKSGNNREFKILAHRHNLKMSNERENGFSLEVIKRTVHKEHDIAIWELEKNTNFRLNNKIRLAPLNDHSSVPGENSNKLVTALGWGWVKTGGPGSSTLMQVEVPLVEQSKCHKLWNKRGVDINIDTQVCAGWPEGRRDTCKGDSGGPLFYEEDGQYYLVGLTSFGDPCAKANTPTVYVRASYFESWIKEHSNLSLNLQQQNPISIDQNDNLDININDKNNTSMKKEPNNNDNDNNNPIHTPIAYLMSNTNV